MSHDPVRVFVGSGEASLLERKVLIHSLRKNSRRDLDICVFNGTHNALERNSEPPAPAPMSLRVKYRSYTEFSLYRYLIPQLCGHQGRGIYVDSDMICLGDIGELFDMPMHGADFLSIKAYDTGQWGPSVMLIDADRCRFDLEKICDDIDAGKFTYSEFSRMDDRFLAHHAHKIGVLDPNWNSFDRYDENTKLIHYTDLMSQPWKFPGHPYGELWFQYFKGALAAGELSDDDVTKAITRGYVRPDIRSGNQSASRSKAGGSSPGPAAVKSKPQKRKTSWLKELSRRLRGRSGVTPAKQPQNGGGVALAAPPKAIATPKPAVATVPATHQATLLRLENAEFRYEPFPIGIARPVFSDRLYQQLLDAWPPTELFAFMPKLGKKYSLAEVNNPEQYHKYLEQTLIWQHVYAEVKSPQFVRNVLQTVRNASIDLGVPEDVPINDPALSSNGSRWAASLHTHRATAIKSRFEFSMLPADGGHIKPHTDSPGKLITLVVSFCDEREWRPSYGGGTTVLRAVDRGSSFNYINRQLEFSETEVLHTFPFEPNQCVIFVKTFNSLHAVSPMQCAGSSLMRKTLTINIELA